ncbi:hypothetical protein J3R82DRAFT_10215 [Butyriboletus roseoflavus]|nr:hypothetical protein J3R82DRAFT_10215 [Butyriboletus roseoflavus]
MCPRLFLNDMRDGVTSIVQPSLETRPGPQRSIPCHHPGILHPTTGILHKTLGEKTVERDERMNMPGVSRGAKMETRLIDVFSPTYHMVLVLIADAASSTDVLEALRYCGGILSI